MSGRFLHLLDSTDQTRMAEVYAGLPAVDADATAVRLFPSLSTCGDHVVRAPRILPSVISMGEYPACTDGSIRLEDLAVGCDGRRMFLAWLATGRVAEIVAPTALNFRRHVHIPPPAIVAMP